MKKILFYASIAIIICSCGNNNERYSTDLVNNPASAESNNKTTDVPVIKFEKTEHNFGKTVQGEKLSYSFKFTNSGKSDLIISQATASCGCTVAEFSQGPIKPGGEGVVSVSFNSEGRKGAQNKAVTV